MKTNTTKVILSVTTILAIAATVVTHLAANYIDIMAAGVGYTAVAILFALALVDYRISANDYARR